MASQAISFHERIGGALGACVASPFVTLTVLCGLSTTLLLAWSAEAQGSVIDNLLTDLATAPEPPPGWTAVAGGATRTGIRIQSVGNTLYYRRGDLPIDNQRAFQIEATVACEAAPSDGERGARMWVKFRDTALPAGRVYNAQIRFVTAGGVKQLQLVDGVTGTIRATLTQEWEADPPLRIRLKRELVEGTDYLLLQAESAAGWDDPANPNNLGDANSQAVALSGNFQIALGTSEFGFGNAVAGDYFSEWHSVHQTTADTHDTILPYWPAQPPAPTLSHVDQGPDVLQTVDSVADLGSPPLATPYLTNDVATLALTHAGGTDTSVIPDPSNANAGIQNVDFPNLADDQTVSGVLEVRDVSGRARTGTPSTAVIPDRTTPVVSFEVFPTGGTDFVALTPGSTFTAATVPQQIAVRVIDKHLNESGSSITINGSTLALTALGKTVISPSEARYAWNAGTSPALLQCQRHGGQPVRLDVDEQRLLDQRDLGRSRARRRQCGLLCGVEHRTISQWHDHDRG